MLENLKKSLDNGFKTGILLTDLSKAFDSVSHDLLLAILNAYGFSSNSLNLINDYLTGRKQRTEICDTFSSWRNITYGVPQGSILGTIALLLNLVALQMMSSVSLKTILPFLYNGIKVLNRTWINGTYFYVILEMI